MNKSQITFLFFLCQLVSANITVNTKCNCSEYSIDTCASNFYCSWDGYKCVDLDCTLESQQTCQPESKMYQCKWDIEKKQCNYHSYTCSQITDKFYCDQFEYHGLDCMWSKIYGCITFSCKLADLCYFSRCSFWQGVCDNPISSINCEALSKDYCFASDGQGRFCTLNDDKKCTPYDAIINCPQFADNQALCKNQINNCVYENTKCREITCEDLKKKNDCIYILGQQSKVLIPCFWTGSRCRTASDLDIQNLSQQQCRKNTYYNYKWEDFKCQACQQQLFDVKLGLIFFLQLLI